MNRFAFGRNDGFTAEAQRTAEVAEKTTTKDNTEKSNN